MKALTVKEYPFLSREDEHSLAVDFYENHNQESAKKPILGSLRYVHSIAITYKNYNLPYEDIFQQGVIGLMKSIKKFNPYQGTRLLTYATSWIKAEILHYIIANFGIVKGFTSKAKRRLFFNLRKEKDKFDELTNKDIKRIADKYNATESDVIEVNSMFAIDSVSSYGETDDESPVEIIESSYSIEQEVIEQNELDLKLNLLYTYIDELDDRKKDIIKGRYLSDDPVPLNVYAERYGISQQRVHQIENDAIKFLKNKFGGINDR